MGQKVQGSSFSSAARDAPELVALHGLVAAKQRAAKLRSRSSEACCVAAKQCAAKLRSLAPELAALRQSNAQQSNVQQSSEAWLRSLLRCGKATRNKTPEPSFEACCIAASKKMKKGSYLFVCAPAAPAPQPQLQLPLQPLQLHSSSSSSSSSRSSSTAARGLWSSGDGVRGGGVGRW